VTEAVVDETAVTETAALLSVVEYVTLIGIEGAPGPASEIVKVWEDKFGKVMDKLVAEITRVPCTVTVAVAVATPVPPQDLESAVYVAV
jgi:hypothetical protein